MEESLETLTQQKEAHLSTNAMIAERDVALFLLVECRKTFRSQS